MTDSYLRGLGFVLTSQESRSNRPAFAHAWRYHYDHLAVDGATLFIEHPLGIQCCWLSSIEAPLCMQDIFAKVDLGDRPGLLAAMQAFFTAHGGIGHKRPGVPPTSFRPYRRKD